MSKAKCRGLAKVIACAAILLCAAYPAGAQETKKMEDTVPIGERLTRDGRVAVYGIFFDSDKASIKSESWFCYCRDCGDPEQQRRSGDCDCRAYRRNRGRMSTILNCRRCAPIRLSTQSSTIMASNAPDCILPEQVFYRPCRAKQYCRGPRSEPPG